MVRVRQQFAPPNWGKSSMTSKTQPTVALNDGAAMPQFGLGVFQTPPDETERVVKMAVDEGYRLVDTASMYRNEDGVGKALLGRTDVFVTTKLGNSDHPALTKRSAHLTRASKSFVATHSICI